MLYFIVNQKARSGKGASHWQEVCGVLREQHMEYKAWMTEYEGHAFSLVREICTQAKQSGDKDICLVVLGGDGTVNEVINGIPDFEGVRIGILPVGSGNDLARGLGIKGSVTENLMRILTCMRSGKDSGYLMDLGEVRWGKDESRLFAISAGLGLDALVCKKAITSKVKVFLNRLHLGKLTYLFLTVQSLFTMETVDGGVRYDKRGNRIRKLIFIAAMNFRAEGGGVPMAPDADAADGKLSVCTAYGIPKWRTFFCLPFLVAAKHAQIHGFSVQDCAVCEVKLEGPAVLHADGEYLGDVDRVRFSCLPGKLRVLL